MVPGAMLPAEIGVGGVTHLSAFAVVLLVLLTVLIGGVGWVLYQIMRQQGRMLLRIDELEQVLAGAMGGGQAAAPVGPPVGSAIEPFTAVALDGRPVSSTDFAGRKALLVNWSATCGYCDMIAPELVAVRPELEKANTALVLLSRGNVDATRAHAEQHGLTDSVYVLDPDANPAGFQGLGTPSAIVVDEEGKVASPLLVGADKVPGMAQELAASGPKADKKKLRGLRSVTESRIQRDGLKAGTPAPRFELPDVYGNRVSLEEFRGRRVLLTFSDPNCGPCEALAPHLARVHQEHEGNNLAVVLVGRGEVEENRRKAEQYGFRFPVVVQESWNLSREYGIFATPVAFLIDETGTIVRDVAKGVDEILALVPESPGGHEAGQGGSSGER
jgi:peroxiredoxin